MSKLKKDFDWEKWDSMSPEEQEIAKDKAITWGRRRPGKVAVDKERKMRGYNIRKDGMFKCHNTKGEQVRWKPWSVESLWRQHNNPGWTRDEADVYNKLGKMPLRPAVSDERIQDIVSESIRKVLSESEGEYIAWEPRFGGKISHGFSPNYLPDYEGVYRLTPEGSRTVGGWYDEAECFEDGCASIGDGTHQITERELWEYLTSDEKLSKRVK